VESFLNAKNPFLLRKVGTLPYTVVEEPDEGAVIPAAV
jgi:hypothetical protein